MKKFLYQIFSLLGIAVLSLTALPVAAQNPTPGEEIAYHHLTGMARFIGNTEAGRPIRPASALPAGATFEQAAQSFLALRGGEFGLRNPSAELSLMRESETPGGKYALRYRQTYQGIPVLAGEIIVHLDARKNVLSASGEILPGIEIETEPLISAEQAAQTALEVTAKAQEMTVEALQASQPELWIYNPALLTAHAGETSLVWRVEVTPSGDPAPLRQLVLVDARRGSIPLTFNQIAEARNRLTYNLNGGTSLPGTLVCNESNPSCTGGPADAINAHIYAGSTYDFYFTHHGRDSIDNAGMAIISSVNYGVNYQNAFWDGDQMVYGTGFANADDVVAHELTHGVTQYESDLFYYWQSGAINESFSDLWGEFVDLTNSLGNDSPSVRWLQGEDLPIGAIRDMSNPPSYGDPDKMTSPNYYIGDDDNGGVHYNSGVNNKAVFLMVDGGSFNSQTVVGLGIPKVAKIYYYAQTSLLTSGADYADLYYALQTSCQAQVGTHGITANDCLQVKRALDAVEMNMQPVIGYNPDAPVCTSPYLPLNHYVEDFENGASNWTSGGLVGPNRWSYGSPYGKFAHSGTNFLYADDYPASTSLSFVRMNNPVQIPPEGKMLFHHAYFFEYSGTFYYDGGVLEYSVDNGLTWLDAAARMDFNGYDGTLVSSFGNPLGGRQGFGGTSHGYISTRLDLAPLAGQNVLFRWSMALDSSAYAWGWWLDDVQIYECVRFTDVPHSYWAYGYIDKLAANGITGGCATGLYCPANNVNRAQMAVFLLRGIHGASYNPPSAGGNTGFSDVPASHWAADWIKQLAAENITSGCSAGNYCPEAPVTRAQMAIFLLKAKYGPTYAPPPVTTGTGFADVPASHWAAAWIKQLAAEGITSGCGGGNYCPDTAVSRAQMAVFLVKTFNLP